MNNHKHVALATCILLIATYNTVWTADSLGTSVYAQSAPNQTAPNQTAPNQTASNQTASNQTATNQTAPSDESALGNLIVDHAGGGFTSLQTDADNKTWIATGTWDLVSDPSNATQSNSSAVQFNATIDMRGTDNSEAHEHTISEFNLASSSIGSSSDGSEIVFNGTATIETDVGLYSEVPISIKIIDEAPAIVSIDTQTNEIKPQWIPEGGTIGVLIDERVEDHFGSTPIYGSIKRE